MTQAGQPSAYTSRQDRYSPILIGRDFAGREAVYNFSEVVNFSTLIAGMSGSGKSHLIRRLVREFWAHGVTPMVLDTQGDLCRGDNRIPDDIRHDIIFRYGSGGATLNPLRIDTGDNMGGFHITVEDVVEIVRVSKGRNLGDRQAADLRQLIIDCYEHHGIMQRDPSTWGMTPPTWGEFHEFVKNLLINGQAQIDEPLAARLHELAADLNKNADWKSGAITAADLVRDTDAIGTKSLQWIQDGLAIELTRIAKEEAEGRYHRFDKNRLESLEHTIRDMANSGLFGDECIRPKASKVNVFDLSALRDTHKLAMFRILLDRTFFSCVRMAGKNLNPPVPSTVVILDEAKYAVASATGMLSPLNRIATEGRKYGLGMVCGVQHLGQLNTDLSANFAAKFVMHMESVFWNDAMRLMRVTEAELESIKPRSDALYKYNAAPTRAVHLLG